MGSPGGGGVQHTLAGEGAGGAKSADGEKAWHSVFSVHPNIMKAPPPLLQFLFPSDRYCEHPETSVECCVYIT